MENHFITTEMLKTASTYVPVIEKHNFIKDAISDCMIPLKVTSSGDVFGESIPNIYRENIEKKFRYLMSAFLKYYMHIPYETEEGSQLITQDEYDKWESAHIFNQLERMKSNSDVRDICFDIMYDYKEFEKRFNCEIYSITSAMNDVTNRWFSTVISILGKTE